NVAKHASASRVQISVTEQAGAITVEVADDGVGGADPKGRGLRGLADRTETLGGTLTVASARGGGTRVAAVIPDGDRAPATRVARCRRWRASLSADAPGRCRAVRCCSLQCQDVPYECPGLRVGFQLPVDGRECPAQGGQVPGAGNGEPGANRARLAHG